MDISLDELLAKMGTLVNDSVAKAVAPLATRLDAIEVKNDYAAEPEKEVKADAELPEQLEHAHGVTDPGHTHSIHDATIANANPNTDEAEESGQNAEIEQLKREHAEMKARLNDMAEASAPLSDDEEGAIADAQTMCDSVYQLFGQRAPKPLRGERLMSYRKRLTAGLQSHSTQFKGSDISRINDSAMLDMVQRQVFADAAQAARRDIGQRRGLRTVEKTLDSGAKMREFVGDMNVWFNDCRLPVKVGKFRTDVRKYVD